MSSMKFQMKTVSNSIAKYQKQTAKRAQRVIAKSALDIEANTKVNIRNHGLIKSGFMLGSVQATPQTPLSWVITIGAFYAIFHEFGTSNIPSRPFFRPACEKVIPVFEVAISKLITE